ncbi:MAG: anti-sigma factor [Ilumatobacter sp.]
MNDRLEPEISDELEALLRSDDVWAEVDPSVIDDTVAAVLREAEIERSEQPVDSHRPELPPPVAPVVDLSARRAARFQGMLLGAAAAAILVVGGFVVSGALGSDGEPADVVLALAATDREPQATGSVELTALPDGTRILIDTDDLPPAPEGFYYEAWMRTGPDFGVSAGTFHLRGGGDGSIVLWSGVAVEDFPLFTVTLQPEGMEQSSGQVVLAGRFEP